MNARTPKAPEFQPIFTDDQVRESEDNHNATWGTKRRLTMIALSRSSTSMIEGFANQDSEVMPSLIDQITDYLDYLKFSIELAESAVNRLTFVHQSIQKGIPA